MKFSDFVFDKEKIVIGSSLEALLCAYSNDLPILSANIGQPSFISHFEPTDNLLPFGIENPITTLPTLDGIKEIGTLHIDLWRHLFFFLSLAGNIPMSNKCFSLRFEEDNVIKAITENSRFARFRFEEAVIFDDRSVSDIPNTLLKQAKKEYKVIDWISIRSSSNKTADYFKTGDDFVNEVYLYPSDRVDGLDNKRKDAVAISYLTGQQLQEFEYSDTYVRFKVLKLFKAAGFRGNSNGWSMEDPTKKKYYALKIETSSRDRYQLERDLYENTEKIKFNYETIPELLDKHPTDHSKPRILCEKFDLNNLKPVTLH